MMVMGTGKKMVAFVCSIRHSLTLKTKTLGIIGYGTIGKRVGEIAKVLV
ncbi:MAG: hypothetical protein U1E91_01620 [Moraxella sp.]